MGRSGKFDLNQALVNWRKTLLESNALDRDEIQELENHLLDLMEELMDKGLEEDEAFWIAQNRLGEPNILVNEYRKVEPMSTQVWLRTIVGGTALFFACLSLIHSFHYALSAFSHVYVTSCSGLIFFEMFVIITTLFAVNAHKIKIDRLKSSLEQLLIDHTIKIIGFAVLLKCLERFIVFLIPQNVPAKQFGNIIMTANLMTLLVTLAIIISLIVVVGPKQDEMEREFV